MNSASRRSVPIMGTIVTIEAAGDDAGAAMERAFGWFREIERLCNRFDADSELRRLVTRPGIAVPVSPILYAAVEFALAVAEDTGGAFDPTVGLQLERRGFNRDYRSGQIVSSGIEASGPVSYRDVQLDAERSTITVMRPLVLDLGAIAKGLAIDMAARELAPVENYAIDAGGDLYVAGHDSRGDRWAVGIRHPRREQEVMASLRVSDAAVFTSGDYERTAPGDAASHHICGRRRERHGDCANGDAGGRAVDRGVCPGPGQRHPAAGTPRRGRAARVAHTRPVCDPRDVP